MTPANAALNEAARAMAPAARKIALAAAKVAYAKADAAAEAAARHGDLTDAIGFGKIMQARKAARAEMLILDHWAKKG